MTFDEVYKSLNNEQRSAVDEIDGPMLVLAGPGTGKTQLLSARVANILRLTDTLPENILCLTFTESGADNMQERLAAFIGQDAYDVHISTYHAFGAELIRRYPEYFDEYRLQAAIDEIGKLQILADIVDSLPYSSPLKFTSYALSDLASTLSDLRRGLLAPGVIRAIAKENGQSIERSSVKLKEIFKEFSSMPRALSKARPVFEQVLYALQPLSPKAAYHQTHIRPLIQLAATDLENSLEEAVSVGKSTPLTAWKNKWLEKDSSGNFILSGQSANNRLEALADVLEAYEERLQAQGMYDFDDMILKCIHTLTKNDALRFTLQEKYLYILLDEFQDTNAAQLKLIELLTNNPASYGRPNIMAVGDDDQAIYAFQGAETSNMIDFYNLYTNTTVINLLENYRSHRDILHVAHHIAKQIESRLHDRFEGLSKILHAKNSKLPDRAVIERHEFTSDIEEMAWISGRIAELIKNGIEPKEIAVLAPKHKVLEPLVPHLALQNVPVSYEKREDILEAPSVRLVIDIARLALALRDDNRALSNSLWPAVLSRNEWGLSTELLWRASWQVGDTADQCWTPVLISHQDDELRRIAQFMLEIARMSENESLEIMLDYIVGLQPVKAREHESKTYASPLYHYYTHGGDALLYETLSHLSVQRAHLRARQQNNDKPLMLQDLVDFVTLYETTETRLANTSPYHQSENAVRLMTVYKAKGLEFEYVFLPSCLDDVWGSSTRDNTSKVGLPANVAVVRHAGANNDERLRAFFVAVTRAKYGLLLCSHDKKFNGQATRRLRYLLEGADNVSSLLPKTSQKILKANLAALPVTQLAASWQNNHLKALENANMRSLLQERLANYQLSPTHLNTFTDLVHGGPGVFFLKTLLRFPSAPTPSGQFGNAMHETLEWLQLYAKRKERRPSLKRTIEYFGFRLERKKLISTQTELLRDRGIRSLTALLKDEHLGFDSDDVAEHSFKREGVFAGEAHLSGKVDLLKVDKKAKTVEIVDYKTGKSFSSWASDLKLHKYKQQLYCYKLLIEGSHTFRGYTITGASLLFVEPNDGGEIVRLPLSFNKAEEEHIRRLIQAIWSRIRQLDMPKVDAYEQSLAGTRKFEEDLIGGKVKA